MAKRERNKRAARKARQQERERVAVAQANAGTNESGSSKSLLKKADKPQGRTSKKTAIAKQDRKGMQVVTGYFADVRSEMRQVTWPTRPELRNYSVAVIISLIVVGIAVWAIDTGFVALLVQFTGLRG